MKHYTEQLKNSHSYYWIVGGLIIGTIAPFIAYRNLNGTDTLFPLWLIVLTLGIYSALAVYCFRRYGGAHLVGFVVYTMLGLLLGTILQGILFFLT